MIVEGIEKVGDILKSSKKVGDFVAQVFGPLLEDSIGLVSDRLKYFRAEKLALLHQKTQKKLQESGITETVPVPPKVGIPLIENASLEEDDDLHTKWSNMLSNAMNPNNHQTITKIYVSILSEVNPLDIHILDKIYDTLLSKELIYPIENLHKHRLTKENLINVLRISIEDYYISADNLMRSQLIKPAILKDTGIAAGSEPITIYKDVDIITLSPLGAKLVEACK